jgi:polysaccharide export outer membrane protein
LGLVVGSLAGCSGVPTSGPSTDTVIKGGVHDSSDLNSFRYEYVDLTDASVNILNHRVRDSFAGRFGDHRATAEPVIGIGDLVSVTIWEASSGGLFSGAAISDRVSAGANSATIPEQVVGRDGAITVPYAGRVQVAGRTTRAVQAVIEHALEGKAIQPQVLVNVPKSIANTVTVGGEGIVTASRVPLSVRGDRLLDVIATAGGIRAPANETYIELARGSTTARVPMTRVIADPHENIYLRPNDVVTLVRDPETFITQGATGVDSEIPFGSDTLTLAEALSKSGGLQDLRSDPYGIFVFRWESPEILRELKPDSPLAHERREVPVVYRLDLSNPNSFFLQQKFKIANRDLIYISNAPLVEVEKIVNVFNGIIAPATSTATIGVDAAAVH